MSISAVQGVAAELRVFLATWELPCDHELKELRQEAGLFVCLHCERPIRRRGAR
jgi:hypothetical protein